MRRRLGWACWCVVALAGVARADSRALRLVPSEVELVVVAPKPARILPGLLEHPIVKDLLSLELVRELYDSPKLRKLDQLITYLETRLKGTRFDLFERLTDGGMVLGARLSKNPAPLLVFKARDEELLKNALAVVRELVDQELDREDKKASFQTKSYKDIETHHLGKALHVAQAGPFFVLTSDEGLFHAALDLYLAGKKERDAPEACIVKRLPKRELGDKTLVWGWLDFEGVQRNEQFKDQFNSATKDPFIQLFVGGVLDVLKRSPYIEFALEREAHDLRLAVSLPRGVTGMSELAKSFVATKGKSLLPPLSPPRVIAASTWTFDLGLLWKNKKAWLGEKESMDLENGEKELQKYLKGVALGDLLEKAGWNQRIVLAEQGVSPYKIKPRVQVQPFAVVFDMRDPGFAPAIEKVLRTGGLAGTFVFGMRMKEEDYNGRRMICYYFDESRKLKDDADNIRFNFSPSFVQVDNSFVISSTAELARDLVDCLAKEEKRLAAGASFRADLHAAGLALNLESLRKEILVATILDQGLPPTEAGKAIDALIQLVRRSGMIRWNVHYGEDDYRLEFHWATGRK